MAMRGRGTGRPPRMIINRVYEEFKPMSEWRQEDDHDVLLVYLPGFQKEYIKVTTEDKNIVRVRGERLVSENKWSRFQEDYRVPESCEMRGIRAKFDGGILTITMPRKITSAPPPPPPPTASTTSRVAPKTDEQPLRRPTQEEMTRKPEEPKAMPRKITGAPPLPPPPTTTNTTAAATRVAPKTEEQPFRRTMQEEPKAMPRKITGAPPPSPPTTTDTTAATTRVASKTEEQPFRRTKQEETIGKPEEAIEKKPDEPQTGSLKEFTFELPHEIYKGAISNQPKPIDLPTITLVDGVITKTYPKDGIEHDAVEKPSVGKKTDLDKGKEKEATLDEKTNWDFKEKPSSSGVSGGFRAGLEKLVPGRGVINEDRKLLMNVGVGVLIIAALGIHVSYTIGLLGKEK